MYAESRVNYWLGRILQVGIFLSIVLVLLGGVMFLLAHGSEPIQDNVLLATNYNIDILTILQSPQRFSPIGFIELGLMVLVMAQILRVAMLCCYYTVIRDAWFMLFSFFILAVILYSLLWQ